jgi:hypothetical protein
MKARAKAMKQLCYRVAEDMGDGLDSERLFAQKTAFAAAIRRKRDVTHRLRFAVAASAVIAVAVGTVWGLNRASNDPFRFRVGETGTQGETGRSVYTPLGKTTSIAFDQGSRFELGESALAKVASADIERVSIVLERGKIAADVRGNGKTRWEVTAGPYRVTVVGTVFTVDWNVALGVLAVVVERGRVLVEGPNISEEGVAVTRGKQIRVTAREDMSGEIDARVIPDVAASERISSTLDDRSNWDDSTPPALRPLKTDDILAGRKPQPGGAAQIRDEKADDAVVRPGEDVARDRYGETAHVSNSSADRRAITPPSRLTWLSLYENEAYAEAVRAAVAYGIDTLSASLDADQLWKLQDAARISGHSEISYETLTLYRRRFPKGRNAAVACFLLGRIALEHKGAFAMSAKWFTTYLKEAPNGPLAEEALGRLIIVYEKMGRNEEAKALGEQYIERFKGGPFERVAERVRTVE